MCGWLSAEGDRLELSQLGGGLDEIARHLLEPGDDLRLAPRPAAQQQRDLLDAGVEVAREVVRGDRIGIGRNRERDVRAPAPIGHEQLLDPPDLRAGLGRGTLKPIQPSPYSATRRNAALLSPPNHTGTP